MGGLAGGRCGVGLVLVDVSARRQAEAKVRRLNGELEARVVERTRALEFEVGERRRAEEGQRTETERLAAVIATQYDIVTIERDVDRVMELVCRRAQG